MRVAAAFGIMCKVVGGSETAEAPKCYEYALQGRRELCVHDRALRIGGVDASVSYGHTRCEPVLRGGSVLGITVTVGGSKNFPRLLRSRFG